MTDRMYTVDETANRLRISRWTLYTLMRKGEIEYSMVGKRRRVTEKQIGAYLSRCVDGPQRAALQSQSPSGDTEDIGASHHD